MDPAHFLDDVVPALARERAAQFPLLGAPITLAIGTDAWTLTLHDAAHPTRHGGDPNAPFSAWFSEAAFEALMEGTLDAEAALRTRSLGVRGDLHVLEQLGRFLMGSGHAAFARGSTGKAR